MKKAGLFLFAISVLFFCSCHRTNVKISRAFYYWRANFSLQSSDTAYLLSCGVSKIYLHLFDVVLDKQSNRVIPVAKMEFDTPPHHCFEYVPVIYITVKALESTPNDSIKTLANHICKSAKATFTLNNLKFDELQIDCDWTESTREKYFSLLRFLRDTLHIENAILSATIRLHQVKYAGKTGIPPVDRGMLMFYNMGSINNRPSYNSIYNSRDADRYSSYIHDYPLPLDLALPIYSWAIQARDGKVIDLLEKFDLRAFNDSSTFRAAGNHIFVARSSFFLHGRYFMKNDSIKTESVEPALCVEAARNAKRYLQWIDRTVSFFEYDTLYTKGYDKSEIEKICTVDN